MRLRTYRLAARNSWLTLGLLPVAVAGSAWAQSEQTPSFAGAQPVLNGHEERVMSLADMAADRYGFDRVKAFAMAWVAVCAERHGEGRAEEVLRSLAEADDADSMVARLSKDEFHALMEALEREGLDQAAPESPLLLALMKRRHAEMLPAENASSSAGAAGASSGGSNLGTGQAAANEQRHVSAPISAALPASFAGLSSGAGSFAPLPPSGHSGSDHDTVMDEPEPTPPQQKEDEKETAEDEKKKKEEGGESQNTLKMAVFSAPSVGGGFAPRMMMRAMAAPMALAEPQTIVVEDGTAQSVMTPTEVDSVTLGSGSTLYVADTLTLSHAMTVQNDSRLIVKDGGVVQLGTYSDSQSAATNKSVALLFDALLHSATTEGSGVVKMESVSVQFGDGTAYNLADAETGLNAVFAARYEIAKDLQLQNYNQGLAHSTNPTKVPASSWQISESGDVHVKGDLKLSSYQQLDVLGGTLIVDGVATLGHMAGNTYAAKLTIADGSYVQLKQIGDARTQQDGKSELVMTGGELVFTADGNVVTNKLGSITLSGGELVADGHSWVLNHDAAIGSDEGLTIRTDAEHSVTLGVAGTTTTLAGLVSVSEASNAVLNGTYAGTGVVELADGASLTLGQNFSTAAGSSVGLSGTGSVQVNWTGTPGSLQDGFMDSYDMKYTPSGLTGALNLDHADGLVWKDAAGNTLHNVAYEDGVLTGHIAADPTVYHIVTAGHTAVYDAGGNAEGASSFALYNNGNLFIGNGSGVSAAQVTQNGYTLTLQGSGDYVLNGYTLPAHVVLDADGEDKWTGAVVISGTASGNKVQSFNNFYQAGSAIAMNGFDGIPEEWYDKTLSADIRLDAQADGSPAWRWNSGSGRTTVATTFSGNWSGAGDFVLGAKNSTNWLQNFTYTGDISDWTGRFLVESGTTTVTFAGAEKEVNAELDKGTGTLNVKVETDTKLNANVTASDLSITAGKTVEVGRDAVVDITSKTYDGNAFAAFADAMSGAGEVLMKGNTFYSAAGEHDIKTNFVFNSEVRLGNNATTWHVKADAPTEENPTPAVDGSLTVQNGDFFLLQQQTLSIEGGAVNVEKGSIWLGTMGVGSGIEMSSGSLSTQGILVNSAGNGTYASHITMTGGTLTITGDTFLNTRGLISAAPVSLTGGTLLADNHAWTLNTNSTIGAVTVVTQGESGGITIGKQGVTTTLTDMVDNRGTLTLDGTVNLTMETSNTAYGFVDAAGHVNYSGVGFDAQITMPGEVYNVVSGNAAAMGSNLTWTANGQALTVVAEADKESAPANALYFDGFNLRPVKDLDNPETQRTGTIYHMGARGDYTMSAADAAIATGIELTGRGGALHVGTTPANTVSLDLAAGQLVLENGADLTVGKGQNWAMEAGASISLGEGSVLTLPGVWGETTPNSYTNSYSAYHLLHNTSGAGKVLFEGDVSWQFGNAGHNTVSTGGYNILDEYGAENGVNADITFDLEVNGNMLIQNYRQGKDHPEVGSWWKVSEGGSLTVHGNFESSSYQKVSVEGGNVVVDGTYKIGHEAGREYEGDLELKSGSLTVGTLQTVHEDTSTVHISGGKLTVTGDNAFANTFREVSARDAEFEGSWTWNHDATIGNITVTEGSAITLGTADTTLTLESPLKNHGALTLDGTIKADIEKQEGAWAYGTDELGYTPDGDGYYKRTDDLYTLISEGNNATLGENITFILNGEELSAADFNWNGKAIGMGGTEAGTVYYLNTENGYTYTDADSRTTAFELVNAGATLRLERDPAALETIHALGGTLSLGSGVRMESALLDAEATVTMAGEGTYLLSSNALTAHPAAHHVSFADPAWTGTVQLDGMLGTEGTLNGLGNAGSWVEMQGVFGADAAPSMDVNVKLTDTDGSPAWIYTGDGHDVSFTGDWAGEGTFAFAPVGGASQQLTYSGDLSAWTGTFAAEGGTAQLHFAGAAHEVHAAMQQQGGRIELTAETDTHFTNTTQAAVYEAAGGNLVAEQADGEAIESVRATGGDISLNVLATSASITLEELVIGDHRRVSVQSAPDAEDPQPEDAPNLAVDLHLIGEQGTLTAGTEAVLCAGLSIDSGVSISLADRTQGLELHGALSLGDGGDIRLDEAMKTSLKETGRLVLFTGVTELHLADGTVISGDLTTLDHVEAERYFSGLLERLNAEGQGETYFLTFHAGENGGTVCIETPEPTAPTLSLLALAALLARRRRK
ncbi:MAG: hypothetical protein MJ051_05985 [Akkermansia sp.]|nr:hypothetical protein [Akkermansia sp.]